MIIPFINTGVSGHLSAILNEHAIGKRIVVVRGGHSYPKDILTPVLETADCQSVDHISGFSPNPKAEEIEEGLEKIQAINPDVVIGVGGGSIMDIAKVLCCLCQFKGSADDRRKLCKVKILNWTRKKAGLVLMPTTAGSGAEATGFSVVYFGADKFSFLHRGLIADYSIADHHLIQDAPHDVLASSVMDAIAQSIESFWLVAAPTSRAVLPWKA